MDNKDNKIEELLNKVNALEETVQEKPKDEWTGKQGLWTRRIHQWN